MKNAMEALILIIVAIVIVTGAITNINDKKVTKSKYDFSRKFAQRVIDHGKWVVIDTETTGLSKTSEIIQVGVVSSSGEVLFESLVKPKGKISSEASEKHGITRAMVRNSPTWPEVQPILETVLSGKLVLAYNAEYDYRMLRQSARKWGLTPFEVDMECIMLAYAAYRKIPHPWRDGDYKWHKLVNACKDEQIKIINLHSAVGDAILAKQIVDKIIEHYSQSEPSRGSELKKWGLFQ